MFDSAAIFGASGAIGKAFIENLRGQNPQMLIHGFVREGSDYYNDEAEIISLDFSDENEMSQKIKSHAPEGGYNLIIVATGALHQEGIEPEKSYKNISADTMAAIYHINTIVPALIAKVALPSLSSSEGCMAFLSARVGSIADNGLGGWYSYRQSKAALNMLIKNLAIEYGRFHKQSLIVGLHPGTVASFLSEPFQANVPKEKLFSPLFATEKMLAVLETLKPAQTGKVFAWDGEEILA